MSEVMKNYIEEAESALLNEYAILQYNNLFDIKNRNPIFYGQYLSPMQ